MATAEVYGAWLLPELGFGDGVIRVLRGTLQYAIPQVLRKMKCGRFARLGQDASSDRWRSWTDKVDPSNNPSPLPNIRAIAATCATFLHLQDPIEFAILDDSTPVAKIPLLARHLASLEQNCYCDDCRAELRIVGPTSDWCAKKKFFRSLSFLIMDIFALSLFDSTSPLLLRLSVERKNGTGMEMRISHVLKTGDSQDFDDLELIAWARNMVGHVLQGEDSVVISSSKGQVVYPKVFDTIHFEKQGYLKLCCLPGVLKYQGETYDVVSYPAYGIGRHNYKPDIRQSREPVFRPLNLYRGFGSSWSISVRDNRELWAALLLWSSTDDNLGIELNPLSLLQSMKCTLLVDGCPHDPRAELERADRFAYYSCPWMYVREEVPGTSSEVDVIAVDGADDLRCFALAHLRPVPRVLRRNSCLSCCLNVCRDNDIHYLIL